MRKRSLLVLLALFGYDTAAADPARQDAVQVRVLTTEFVLQGKLDRLAAWAAESNITLDGVRIASATDRVAHDDPDLLILDTPRPADLTRVQQYLGDRFKAADTPWIRVGGGPPAFGNLPATVAKRLIGYYGNGGERNLLHLFTYLRAWHDGIATDAIPAPAELAHAGIHHPAAPEPFEHLADYLAWAADRWAADAPRVAFAIHRGALVDGQLQLIDELIDRSEARGQAPMAFWMDDRDPQALGKLLGPARTDVLVNLQHMQNGPARQAEFLALGIPVLSTLTWRDGNREHWQASSSGVSPRTAATLLTVPESWGMTDPLVIAAIENGEPVSIPQQLDALLAKVDRLTRLRRLAPAEKRLAVMFWNHPDGERNVAASNLNVPRSLAHLTAALQQAGYQVPAADESQLIETAQRLLGGYYRPDTLDHLLADDLAETLPLSAYQRWLATLPEPSRQALLERWGEPAEHWALREIDGQPQFVIPAARLGKLLLMPQPPRAGRPGEAYHDSKVPPDHLYLAAYQTLHEEFEADALIHFGTHGTQEWLPGKDRGLATGDYPFLALGDLPVFYPYIQDNIGEAIQARRRGRAVIVSHQTPPFAPAGLYAELRELHALIHEYQQLDEGAVRETTAERIRQAALQNSMVADIGWDEARMRAEPKGFLQALHDHLHELAEANMPLGLHTFGEPASPEHRLATVLQQLGEPYLQALDLTGDEPLAEDFAGLKASLPYRILQRYLRDGESLDSIDDAGLREQLERARLLDAHLSEPGEIEALLAGLAGGFVAPGPGGDPVRNPEVPSGRNLYAFEADKLPTRAAYDAGGKALEQLVARYRDEHDGEPPEKLAFSLWSSEAMRHLGILESQVLHALGVRPVWDAGGRVRLLEIIPAAELGRPRIDVVVQVTSVYRDQFDSFMRQLADVVERLAALDEPGNLIAANSHALARRLQEQGFDAERARRLSQLRLFGNEPGDYGTGVSQLTLDSTRWENDAELAEQFLSRLQYGYGSGSWGERIEGQNLFAEQLRGVQAAVMARSSELNGVLSTDHPFEFLGGLSLAIRHLDGASPSLYISDLRKTEPRTTGAASYLASELRSRYLNPQWIGAMQREGYAGTLEILNVANNLWGWQAADRSMVRADQWQALHDTFVNDQRELGLDRWFEAHNPTAQAQLIERMAEAIRKGYWDASDETRRELAERWQALTSEHGADKGEALTREFIEQIASGFGLAHSTAPGATEPAASNATAGEAVRGQVMQEVVEQPTETPSRLRLLLGITVLLVCLLLGALRQAVGSVDVSARPRRSLFLREAKHEERSLAFQMNDE
ncbi:cobaltochelatase subunit CobN [Stutzerimonas nitrititolerans]|uniref:cobaltochelatase subunit CobN n=1 Tax=Stutzerimonas nitrititolerans TaxID=2482751 RepID=UPI0014834D2E|nr:cobaltochelatase subunit CobN [Stutzerimonas nitrititolerans]NNT94802.1 cobaltochelatase subunit CobN [Stutzerimonas nitrititolerans]